MKHHILIMGAGKVGSLIACLLAQTHDYQVTVADVNFTSEDVANHCEILPNITRAMLDVQHEEDVLAYLKAHDVSVLVSSLPYFHDLAAARIAHRAGIYFFNLTEDTAIIQQIHELAHSAAKPFVPQCGLAPGFISIAANHMMQGFSKLEQVKLRVGALPVNANNVLQYALTWSTDGLINEYGNPCYAIERYQLVELQPLEGLEKIEIDGLAYEAFNTSGGLGSLVNTYQGKVEHLNYKTIRYPGHCYHMQFLMNDLKLNEDRKTLKRILERALPRTYQDVVLIYIAVSGIKQGEFLEEHYVKKIYPQTIANKTWSALQVTTASSICAVIDIVLHKPDDYQGLVLQEHIALTEFLANRFGKVYR